MRHTFFDTHAVIDRIFLSRKNFRPVYQLHSFWIDLLSPSNPRLVLLVDEQHR
jgi:hypothetical protein